MKCCLDPPPLLSPDIFVQELIVCLEAPPVPPSDLSTQPYTPALPQCNSITQQCNPTDHTNAAGGMGDNGKKLSISKLILCYVITHILLK